MSDPQTMLGQLIDGDVRRDAVHIAVAPVIAAERLFPGQPLAFMAGSTENVHAAVSFAASDVLGIVDPFLSQQIFPGQRFWMFLLPNTITGLNHIWTHPAFKDTPRAPQPSTSISASEQWLRDYAESSQVDLTYNALMEGAKAFLDHGEYLCDGGKWEGVSTPAEFWTHYKNVTGVGLPANAAAWERTFFTCSC